MVIEITNLYKIIVKVLLFYILIIFDILIVLIYK